MGLKVGNEVNTNDNVDLKEVSLRLKQDESVRVILLGTEDYVQFNAHNDFANKIYPQPCLLVDDENTECPYCVASENGMETLKPKKRMKFAFFLPDQNKVMYWEATNAQGKKLIKQIKEYAEDIGFGSIFNFKRTGTGQETDYNLGLISERKYTAEDKAILEKVADMEVTIDDFIEVCKPRSRKLAIGLLNEVGFPVTDFFADAEDILAEQAESADSDEQEDSDDIEF